MDGGMEGWMESVSQIKSGLSLLSLTYFLDILGWSDAASACPSVDDLRARYRKPGISADPVKHLEKISVCGFSDSGESSQFLQLVLNSCKLCRRV